MGYNGYDIEEGMELPKEYKSTAGRKALYPFARLEIGQGFFVRNKLKRSLAATVLYWSKKLSQERGDKTEFRCADDTRNGIEGCAVKRIS